MFFSADFVESLESFPFVNASNKVQTSKFDTLSRPTNDSRANIINNGTDYLHSNEIISFPHQPSVAAIHDSIQSSITNSASIDIKTNISNQNSVTNSAASNFSSTLCKIKLPNNRNLHPTTDVT